MVVIAVAIGAAVRLTGALLVDAGTILPALAARNLGRFWPMRGFIGAERLEQAPAITRDGELLLANRWAALADFGAWAADEGFAGDERTALLIDLDKTSRGARGAAPVPAGPVAPAPAGPAVAPVEAPAAEEAPEAEAPAAPFADSADAVVTTEAGPTKAKGFGIAAGKKRPGSH